MPDRHGPMSAAGEVNEIIAGAEPVVAVAVLGLAAVAYKLAKSPDTTPSA